jgi:hypothetical protein
MSVKDGIIIGAFGGAFAGITVWLIQVICTLVKDWWHKRRVYMWLRNNTSIANGKEYRSTRAIASWNNLTEDRARFICSVDKRIYLSTGPQEDMWSICELDRRSL